MSIEGVGRNQPPPENETKKMELTDAQLAALAKVAPKNDLLPGEHFVDFMVRITGTIKKGEDYEQVIAQSAAPWKLLAAALNMLNQVSIDKIVREAEEIAGEDEKALKTKVSEALEKIKGPTTKWCHGKTTAKLTFVGVPRPAFEPDPVSAP